MNIRYRQARHSEADGDEKRSKKKLEVKIEEILKKLETQRRQPRRRERR